MMDAITRNLRRSTYLCRRIEEVYLYRGTKMAALTSNEVVLITRRYRKRI
jgi:hypothetical protein